MPAATTPAKTGSATTSRRWVLAALMCTMLLAAMDTTIVSTAVPQIVADLGGFGRFSGVFSAYLLTQTVTIPIYGKLSDLYGRKPVLIGGTLLFLAGSGACALAWGMPALIGFRAVQGLGAGAVMATVATLAGDLYSVRERAAIQGWLSSVWGMAALAGPLLGGAFAEYVSWRWIFLVNLPIGALALLLIGRHLHEPPAHRRPRIDVAGAVLVLGAVGGVMYALLQGGQAWPWRSWQTAALVLGSTALALLLVRVERRAAEPILPSWLWSRPVLAGSTLATLGMGVAMMAPSAYLPTFLQSALGMGAIGAGLVLASMSLGWPLASGLSGRLYMRIGFRDTALAGSALILLAAAGFLWIPRPQPVWLVTFDQIALGAGFGLLSTPLLVGVQATVGWSQRGVVTGANMFSRYLGQSLGAALFGAVFNATLAQRLDAAPAALAAQMPGRVDQVVAVLQASSEPTVAAYLRAGFDLAMRHLFFGVAMLAVAMALVLLAAPRRFVLATAAVAGSR